jgi:hypothetical protein
MEKRIVVIGVFFGLMAVSCTKTDLDSDQKLTLRQSVENNVNKVNNALTKISQTKGFQLLSINEGSLKSANSYSDSITLKLIAGIYTFQPDTANRSVHLNTCRLFKKTGDSEMLIVNLPQKLIFHPRHLHNFNPLDSTLKNDFKITATDYHFYYSRWDQYDYKISAGFNLDTANLGNLDLTSGANPTSGYTWSSKYSFTGGYNITVSGQTGDTTRMAFSLSNRTETLLKETVTFVRSGFRITERQYVLSIGNVDIKRSSGIDSIQVYLNGVLQKKAGAKIIESANDEGSICHSRDIQLTFDDGTTINLSTLIQPAMTILKTLVNSLHSMYFAKNIVDYIAINIYYYSH